MNLAPSFPMRLRSFLLLGLTLFSVGVSADEARDAIIRAWQMRIRLHILTTFENLEDQVAFRRERLGGPRALEHRVAIQDLGATLDWRLPGKLIDLGMMEDGLAEKLDEVRAELLKSLDPLLLKDLLGAYRPDDVARVYRGHPLPPSRLLELIRARLGWSTCGEVVALKRKS